MVDCTKFWKETSKNNSVENMEALNTEYLKVMKCNYDEDFVRFMENLRHLNYEKWRYFSVTSARNAVLSVIEETYHDYVKNQKTLVDLDKALQHQTMISPTFLKEFQKCCLAIGQGL